MQLIQVPVKTPLSEVEEFLIENTKGYGIIAGGFPAYLYNVEKIASDIDLFVHEVPYDVIYRRLASVLPLGWRLESTHPRASLYDSSITLQHLRVTNYNIKNVDSTSRTRLLQIVRKDASYDSVESILEGFDWNVCKAAVLDKSTLLVDEYFVDDMASNRLTFRPYTPRKTINDDYGWRLVKYVEVKNYDCSFGDMLTVFGLAPNKRKFYDQITQNHYDPTVKNKNLQNLINFIKMMKAIEWPDLNTVPGDF